MKTIIIILLAWMTLSVSGQHPFLNALLFADSIDVLETPENLTAFFTKAFFITDIDSYYMGNFNDAMSLKPTGDFVFNDIESAFKFHIDEIKNVDQKAGMWEWALIGYSTKDNSPMSVLLSKGGNVMSVYHPEKDDPFMMITFTDRVNTNIEYLQRYKAMFPKLD